MESLGKFFAGLEGVAVDLVARAGPWLSPLPTAYLTARATLVHLEWPLAVAVAAGMVIEFLGLAATSTALTLRAYNGTKRKSDPRAPFALAVVLVGVYFFSVVLLTVLLDTVPALAPFAPLAFPVLSLSGVATLAIRGDHRRRLAAIAQDKAARRARRLGRRSKSVSLNHADQNDRLTAANETRQTRKEEALAALVDFFADNPGTPYAVAGESVGRSKSWVVGAVRELEAVGKVRRNGRGVEVVK